MDKRIALSSLAVFSLMSAATAHAESQPGFYVGAGVGQASVEADDVGFDADDTAFKVFGGYALNDNFAVELTYFDGGQPDETLDAFGIPVTVEAEVSGLNLSAVGRLPINDTFAVFGKVGYASYDVEVTGRSGGFSISDDSGDDDLSYGLGAQFSFGAFSLRGEYEAIDVSDGAFSIISVSGQYRF